MSTTKDIIEIAELRLREIRADEKRLVDAAEQMLKPIREERAFMLAILDAAKPKRKPGSEPFTVNVPNPPKKPDDYASRAQSPAHRFLPAIIHSGLW